VGAWVGGGFMTSPNARTSLAHSVDDFQTDSVVSKLFRLAKKVLQNYYTPMARRV
jgi:hypothetical protein